MAMTEPTGNILSSFGKLKLPDDKPKEIKGKGGDAIRRHKIAHVKSHLFKVTFG